MNIQPISGYTLTMTGSKKIPQSSYIKQQEKLDGIQAMKLASVFKDFENKLRETMETFIYMIKL